MEPVISPKEAERLMNLSGKVRGVAFKTEEDFILREEGEEGLRKIEEALENVGCPLRFKEVKPMDFYPLGYIGLTQLLLKRVLNYSDEKIKELGRSEAKVSLIMKLFMKYFVSLDRVSKEVPKMWRKYYSVGNLKVIEKNEKEKRVIIRLEDFKVTPLHCLDLVGYFSAVLQMVVNSPVKAQETRCPFKGDQHHEFLLEWE